MLHNANITPRHSITQYHTIILCYFLAKYLVTNGLQKGYIGNIANVTKLDAVRCTGISFDVIHMYNILISTKSSTPTNVLVSISIGEKKALQMQG